MRAINKFPLILLLAGLLVHEAIAQEQIGVASAVNKNTTDLTLEQERKLIDAGYEIIQNHTIETDGIGRAQMLLLDGTAFSVGPNSSVVLDKFIYNPETAEGSLEVTARGLLRIVGGKVTKKQPALIRTNSATVGIRGGIGIVQTNGPQTIATFLYGDEMTVTPNCVDLDTFGDLCSNDFITTVTEPGFSVSVEDEDSEPSEPVEVTEESLDAIQEELEAPEEAPEEESAAEETVAEESPTEETQEEEATTTEETSSDESTTEETASEETTTESTETETEVVNDDAGDSTDIEVDEGLLDSSGVSDVSSDVAPDELGTAEEFEVAIELETVEADDANENPTEEVAEETSEAAETSIQDTVSNTQGETAIETATFEVSFNQATLEVEENTSDVTIGVLEIDNPYDSPFTVSIEGEDSNQFSFNEETNTLTFTGSSDYETQSNYSLNLKIARVTGDILIPLTFSVTDINEPSVISINLSQESFLEDLQLGSIIAESSVADPENDTISYTLTGTGSDNFSVSSDGVITLTSSLDYESTTSYNLTLTASDGTHETTSEIAFSVTDVYEPIELSTTLAAGSFSEGIATGTTIVTATAIDPEGDVITYSLSGTGSENFSISSDGTVTLANTLDYETSSSYTITLTATDGTNSVESNLTITVSDVNETITLSSSLASGSFAENTASGTTIATSTATDPEGETITYSLSGTGSDNFSISNDGTITLASSLDYETLTSYNLVLSASDGTNTETTNLVFSVSNVEEAVTMSTTLASSSFAEDISVGTLIVNTTAADPDGNEITYTLTGTGSDNFSISNDGSITLLNSLDYESQTSYSLTLTASDGSTSASSDFTFSVTDIEELIDLSTSLAASSFAEDTATGTTIATVSATNTGSDAITFSLSGTGSENFSVSSDGTVTLNSALDFESTTSYNLTLTASDGTNSTNSNLGISVTDVNEAVTLSTTLAASSFSEGTATGTTIATASATDPENATISYTLSGSGSDKFSVSSDGTVTLNSALDFESTTSYNLTLTASDGTNSTNSNLGISVTDVNEAVTLSTTLAASSFSEGTATGTTIVTASATDPENATISYTLSGSGSDKFSVSSDGTVTLSSSLDYESTTSHNLTLTASDGTNSTNTSFTVSVTNVDLSLSSSLASTSKDENISTGTAIATSSTSNAEGAVTYSLTDADNKFSINSSTGAVTLANALDYETKTSHQFTITATDGVTTTSQTFTLSVSDAGDTINTLAVTLANSGAAIVETSNSGTAVASSSIDNPTSESISYSLSGTGSSDFAVDSSGNITTNTTLDFETAKSYSLTLTASGGGTTVTNSFTVNVGNVEELESAVLRYSASPGSSTHQLVISGWSVKDPIRGNQTGTGSGLPAYTLEQVGTTNTTDITSVVGLTSAGDYVPVVIDSGTALNWRYYFPVNCGGGACWHSSFNPSRVTQILRYYSPLGTAVTTNVTRNQTISGGRLENAEYWFMTTAFNAANITYESATGTNSTYYLYQDQVTLAGEVYKDANFISFTDGNKRVIAMVVLPIENHLAYPLYFYPNFIPKSSNFWNYGNVGLNYCLGLGLTSSVCSTRSTHHYFLSYALRTEGSSNVAGIAINTSNNSSTTVIDTSRFSSFCSINCSNTGATNELPEGMSMWWQVLNPNGVGVGLWAQISLTDNYDPTQPEASCVNASGCSRDNQQSLLNVVISNVDYRKNDTTRYSASDIGLGMNGYHYWSYQGATDADDYSKTLTYGTSPIECATSNDTGCFWGETSNQPLAAMITSSDPYKSGDMTLARTWNSSNYYNGTFNISAVVQDVKTSSSSYADYVSLSDFRSSDFYSSSASSYSGFFSGILEFAPSGGSSTMAQLTSMRSSSTLASFTFDTTNDTVQVVVPMTISAPPLNNYTGLDIWRDYVTGSMTLKFGDANNGEAKSAYISSEVFAAEIQNDGAQIDASSGGSNNLAGVMVSYNTLEKGDADLFNTDVNDSMPNTDYSTWGFWAMAAIDIAGSDEIAGRAAVHLGTWVGGEVVAQNEIPTSGSASMSGAAVMKVAYRYNQTGTSYDVHKYTTTADVGATFNWGASGYSGTLAFTNFDDKNPIVDNAGFASFSVAIAGTDHTYTGDSTDTLDNSWLGGASVAGALYGGSSPQESGGRVNVSLYKTGDRGTTGANDFYMAEGIYLVD